MTPEAQRIAIAEACGWIRFNHCWAKVRNAAGQPHAGAESVLSSDDLPDYLTDLNAMHEAEKVLTPEQQATYAMMLHEKHGIPLATFWHRVICSTAAQRAEAFLKTLNLWKP